MNLGCLLPLDTGTSSFLPTSYETEVARTRQSNGELAACAWQVEPKEDVMKNLIQRFIREEEGQDVIEYALLAAFISIVAVLVIISVGTDVNLIYDRVKVQTGSAAS